jgi:LEA14-like dessication related protein
MGKSSKILTYVGIATVVFIIGKGVATKITDKLTYGFKSLRFINFWGNIRNGRAEMETVLTIDNGNTTQIEVTAFDGFLVHKEEKLVRLYQDIPVILKSKTSQPIKFTFKLNVFDVIAKMYLIISGDRKRTIGTRIVGDLSVVIDGLSLTFPYDEAVTIDL